MAMRCPSCKAGHTTVYDSRMAAGETVIRRRRKCAKCGHRFTTYEGASTATVAVAEKET